MQIKVKKMNPEAVIPTRATAGSAGLDIHSLTEMLILPGESYVFETGLAFEIPQGYFMSILGRSGLAFVSDVVACHTGTIDSDYRGEVRVKLWNMGKEPVLIEKGDRIAQAIILPVPEIEFVEVEELSGTDRGANGFGHTGR